jgi:hypothetical protein
MCAAASVRLCELVALLRGALPDDWVPELCRSFPLLLSGHDHHHHRRALHRSGAQHLAIIPPYIHTFTYSTYHC